MHVFGPVPSRRLGRSLGINNIPPKTCTYSCVYCQIGRTNHMQIDRDYFYDPSDIINEVEEKLKLSRMKNEKIDYLTFVPDGEPTLDSGLGEEIDHLRHSGSRIAVITNSSLLWMPEVREDLSKADLVSVKIDTVLPDVWRRIDRPHNRLDLKKILDGIRLFANSFEGELITETMLAAGINDNKAGIEAVAQFIHTLQPSVSYISAPTRPPSESWVEPPEEETLNLVYMKFYEILDRVKFLISYEGTDFALTGNVEDDLLAITSVHPMREDAVRELLRKADADMSVAEKLIEKGLLVKTEFGGNYFYLRSFSR